MKKLTTFLLSICFLFFLSCVTTFAYTNENETVQIINTPDAKSSINDVRIRFAVTKPSILSDYSWADFLFVDQGNGVARLKHIYKGKIYEPHEIDPNRFIMSNFDINFINDMGHIYHELSFTSINLQSLAINLGAVKMRYGLDSIQIIPRYDFQTSIIGPIHANLENENFSDSIFRGKGQLYRFTLERDGLYSEILNQSEIAQGKYIIESTKNPNHFLYADHGLSNVIVKSDTQVKPQVWDITFNKKYRAYEIKLAFYNLAWASNQGNNVVTYNPLDGVTDQLWYFKDLGNGRYGIFSAKQKHKFLNLDVNNQNISVAKNRNNSYQSFKLTKVD